MPFHYVIDNTILLNRFVMTYRFSQDAIELFFGVIRRKLGCNNNPTSIEFRTAYKKNPTNP